MGKRKNQVKKNKDILKQIEEKPGSQQLKMYQIEIALCEKSNEWKKID